MTPAPGQPFPELELPDHYGNVRRLSELAGGDPVFLQFYRGFWCPKEQAFFRRLVQFQDEAEVAYTRFVSVSVDRPEVEAAFRAGLGARWTFLSDAERRYLAPLDLLETTDTLHRPYVPAVFTLFPTRSTLPTTATGSGVARHSKSCVRTFGTSRARSGPTGRFRADVMALVRPDRRASRQCICRGT